MYRSTKEVLIIFTRYPEAGKTKTRMIPALGAEGAAELQRQMAERTLMQAKKLQEARHIYTEVYFTGGDRPLMQAWLGTDVVYKQQAEGNLGQRMRSAFEMSFAAGMNKIVIIGVDCPDLNTGIINEAFDLLDRHELILGPAADGGYYLIGLNRPIPELFVGINWGTSEVLQQTITIAKNLEVNFACLPTLHDVDRPEDLVIWEKYQQ
jgi:hypothetical protein